MSPNEIPDVEKTIADAETTDARIRKLVSLDVAVPQGRE